MRKQDTDPIPLKELTPLEQTKLFLETFEFTDALYVYSSELSGIQVPVYADNALEQVRFTNHLIYCLKGDIRISTSTLEDRVHSIYLRDFFVDNNGNYDDVVTRTKELAEASLKLIHLYLEKELTEQTDNNTFHNRLVLGTIMQAIEAYYQSLKNHATSYRTGYQNRDS